jgi:hypothetical protein
VTQSQDKAPAAPLPAVVYAAKSSPDERDSIETQVAEVAAAVEREGGRQIMGEPHAEQNVSAFRGERGPALEAAMAAAEQAAEGHGEAELWVWHSSRLARGSGRKGERSLNLIHAQLLYANVQVRSVEDDEFVRNAMLVGVASEQNRKYSADLSGWVKAGKRRQAARGEHPGGPVCDGYRLVKDVDDRGQVRRSYAIDPERAPIIRMMFELKQAGVGDPTIGRKLNAAGYRTRQGNPFYRRAIQGATPR